MEAVKASLEKLSNDEVRVRVIHGGVGAINESDVMLASTSQAIIVGFNVRPDNAARDSAARAHVDMRMYRVIYDAINEIESAMKGMLAPKFRLLCPGRQAPAEGLPGPPGPGRHRHPRGRSGLPAAVQGLRQGGGRRLRVRPVHREVQRYQGRRYYRGLHHGGDPPVNPNHITQRAGASPALFSSHRKRKETDYGIQPHSPHQ